MNGNERFWGRLRLVGWSLAALILLLPLIARSFTDEVHWSPGDFLAAGLLLGGTGLLFELALRRSRDDAFRWGALVALAAGLLLAWSNAAVGIVGAGANTANALYFAVLAIGLSGCWVAGFQAKGMSMALFATAVAQALVTGLAVLFNWGRSADPIASLLGINAFFVALWIGAALLFRRSAERGAH
ncbi:MAG: hypothetical protein JST66_05330 [Bacteroidetes bacterium]|nr:hypothetical protein [Bacteroidota bacterium]